MQPLSIDLRLLSEMPGSGLRLSPGRGLMARVMQADGSGRGLLNIAGAVIEAQLPRHIRAGEQLRLVVRHLDAQRVVLELPREGEAASVPLATALLPGGGQLRVLPDEEDAGGGEPGREPGAQTVGLSYDAPALGPLDLRFELGPTRLRVIVAAAPGPALELARAQSADLREALARTADRPVTVTVRARREPLDLYA